MNPAEIYFQGRKPAFPVFRKRLCDFPYPDRSVVMNARFLRRFQVFVGAAGKPAGGHRGIVKTDGPYGPGNVSLAAGLAAGGVCTQQAA